MISRYRHLLRAAFLILLACVFIGLAGFMSAPIWGEGVEGGGLASDGGKIPFPAPDTHKGNWIRYHGSYVDSSPDRAGQSGRSCYVCHLQNDCTECHSTRPPGDHTGTWRTRTHGLAAGGNRERCVQCHRQDYCVRCHQETAPRSHRGNWRGQHCTWCHFGSGLSVDDRCGVCHRAASHTSAPHPVTPGLDCYLCHT